jgi:desulfoferrodoxin (superoxide reductase-like protein)
LRYGWRKEKHIPNIVIGDMDGGEKPYTKHFHLRYGWRKEKHIPNIVI